MDEDEKVAAGRRGAECGKEEGGTQNLPGPILPSADRGARKLINRWNCSELFCSGIT